MPRRHSHQSAGRPTFAAFLFLPPKHLRKMMWTETATAKWIFLTKNPPSQQSRVHITSENAIRWGGTGPIFGANLGHLSSAVAIFDRDTREY